MDDTVNIIVVGYNLPKIDRACLKAITANTARPYVLTYFDNWESGKTLTQVWNWLIGASPCEYICLLNNDTEVHPGWLKLMLDTLKVDDKVGFVGPSTNSCHTPQKTVSTFEQASALSGQMEVMKDPISGFCILFRKSLWAKLHGFDERFTLYGQESDFIDRAKRLGYCGVWRKDAFVFHHGELSMKTHKIDIEEERGKAKKIYWGDRKQLL